MAATWAASPPGPASVRPSPAAFTVPFRSPPKANANVSELLAAGCGSGATVSIGTSPGSGQISGLAGNRTSGLGGGMGGMGGMDF